MSTILVTGADGFTGRYLVDILTLRGHNVHGLVRRPLEKGDRLIARCGNRIHQCDLSDAAGLAEVLSAVQPDQVAHLAAIAFVAHGDVDSIYRTNLLGTRNLLAALAQAASRLRTVLLASSANVYGNATGGTIDETTAPAPVNDYSVSKLAMEYMAKTWAAQLPIQIVRPFNYTGVGQSESFLIPKIVAHYKRRAPTLELGNLHVERDFSDVRMVVDCYRRLLEIGEPGPTVNVCTGIGYSLQQVLDMAASLSGHQPTIRVNPAFVRANEVQRLVGSKAALEQRIGPVGGPSLEETLAWMLAG